MFLETEAGYFEKGYSIAKYPSIQNDSVYVYIYIYTYTYIHTAYT